MDELLREAQNDGEGEDVAAAGSASEVGRAREC